MPVCFLIHPRAFCQLVLGGCLAFGVASAPSYAEDAKAVTETPAARTPGGRPDPAQMLRMQRERLDQLGLSDEQKKKLDNIFSTAEADLKKASEGDRSAMAAALKDVREKVAEVLTDDQKSKFQAARGAGPGAGAGAGGGAIMNVIDRLEKSLAKLDLSAEQKTKVEPVIVEAKKKFAELRSQLESGDRAAMREKFKAAMDETRDKLKDILTPEQAVKLKTDLEAARPAGAPGRPGATPAETPAKPVDK